MHYKQESPRPYVEVFLRLTGVKPRNKLIHIYEKNEYTNTHAVPMSLTKLISHILHTIHRFIAKHK